MAEHISKDPLHGVTLEALINALVARYGWAELAQRVNINCFKSDPSVKSSLKFLRRTPWARAEVEALYIASLSESSADEPQAAERTDDSGAADTSQQGDPWGKWRQS